MPGKSWNGLSLFYTLFYGKSSHVTNFACHILPQILHPGSCFYIQNTGKIAEKKPWQKMFLLAILWFILFIPYLLGPRWGFFFFFFEKGHLWPPSCHQLILTLSPALTSCIWLQVALLLLHRQNQSIRWELSSALPTTVYKLICSHTHPYSFLSLSWEGCPPFDRD